MPLLRTETGCRWRKTLVSMTTTRLRRSRGAGWRKMLFQTCELRMKSATDMGPLSDAVELVGQVCNLPGRLAGYKPAPRDPARLSDDDVRFGLGPVATLELELHALVHDDL